MATPMPPIVSRSEWEKAQPADKEFTMKLKRIVAGAAVVGALGFASIGIGAGQANADDWCWWGWCNVPPPPGQFVPSPGHIGQWDRSAAGSLGSAVEVVEVSPEAMAVSL
jgi:hypothetical protein